MVPAERETNCAHAIYWGLAPLEPGLYFERTKVTMIPATEMIAARNGGFSPARNWLTAAVSS